MSPKSKWLNAVINEFAPDFMKAALHQWLGNKTKEQAYSFLLEHRDDDWYDLASEKTKRLVERLAPSDLDWLDTKWAIEAVAEVNPKVASLILSSPELLSILADKVEKIKRRICES